MATVCDLAGKIYNISLLKKIKIKKELALHVPSQIGHYFQT